MLFRSQIEVLLKIDGARETAELAQGKISERVAEMQDQRDKRATLGEERKIEVEQLKIEIEETRKEVEPGFLSTYDRVSKIVSRPPYMAPIKIIMVAGITLMLLQAIATFFRDLATARGLEIDGGPDASEHSA